MKHIRHSERQTKQVFTALVITSMISIGAGFSLVDAAGAKSIKPAENPANLLKKLSDNNLPVGVVTAVSREISRTYRVSQSQLKVVKFSQETWSDSCFGLGTLTELCARSVVNGWRVVMSDGSQNWTYRTDSTGRAVRQETQVNNNSNLPQSVSDLVLRTAAKDTGLRTSELRIVKTEQLTVDGCLGLARPGEPCTKIAQRAWEVTVEAKQQRLVYRANQEATQIRLNEAASNVNNSNTNLPQSINSAVLKVAASDFGVSSSQLRITKAEQQTWENSCLGLQRPTERCMGTSTPGWRVTVVSRQKVQVYRTDSTGDRIRAENITGQLPGNNNLPDSVQSAVLRDISRRTNISTSALRIVKTEKRDWPNGCLGIAEPGVFCTQAIVSGWRVTVEGGGQTFVYRTNESGSVVKSESGGLQGNNGSVQIPRSELPPPLAEGVVFRAISSGGFAGITSETVLMDDGRVMQRSNSRIQTSTQISRLSRQEVRQFQRLLEKQKFSQFDRLSFPAPRGAADFFTVTITGEEGTTRYADIVQEQLPESLRSVIVAWNQIVTRR